MTWTNYHTHTRFSDGFADPEEYIREAIRQGMPALGFSEHAPLPFDVSWTLKDVDVEYYCKYINDLKRKYADRISIRLGLEIDYIPGVSSPRDQKYDKIGLDYRIGSVHFVGQFESGDYWGIDSSKVVKFTTGLEEIYNGDIRKVVHEYYHRIRLMTQTQCPDIIGHFDLIKMNGLDRYFDEKEKWYQNEVLETVQVIAGSPAIIEVNTGGIARERIPDIYPSAWILERCRELSFPVILGSDAHKPEQITGGFEFAAGVLKRMGYEEVCIFK